MGVNMWSIHFHCGGWGGISGNLLHMKRPVADRRSLRRPLLPSLQRLINGVISEPPEILGLTARDAMSLLPALTQLAALLQEEKASVPPSSF